MKRLFTLALTLISLFAVTSSFAQTVITQWDLPLRGETYIVNNMYFVPLNQIDENVFKEGSEAFTWDLSQLKLPIDQDTFTYGWVEGNSGRFDFPEANMLRNSTNPQNGIEFFKKDASGLYLAGNFQAIETPQGNSSISIEFRPAMPIIKTPAKLGDSWTETSTAKTDFLGIGTLLITATTDFNINGYGTIKLPGGDEYEVIRAKRILNTEVISTFSFMGQEVSDTSYEVGTSYEFFTNSYGDAVARIDTSRDETTGNLNVNFQYRGSKEYSSIDNGAQTVLDFNYHAADQSLQLNVSEGLKSVHILNANGQIVHNAGAVNNNRIGIAELSTGIYLIRATDFNGRVRVGKFIKY